MDRIGKRTDPIFFIVDRHIDNNIDLWNEPGYRKHIKDVFDNIEVENKEDVWLRRNIECI